MLDELRREMKKIFENTNPFTLAAPANEPAPITTDTQVAPPPITEEEEDTSEFIYTGSDGNVYKVVVEKDEEELNVFDQHGKKIDIFTPDMIELNGGLPADKRKALFDYYKTQANKDGTADQEVVPE